MNLRINPRVTFPLVAALLSFTLSLQANSDKSIPAANKHKTNLPLQNTPCKGIKPWGSSTIYLGGEIIVYNGRKYRAKWWTQGDTPGTALVWEDEGPCT